MEEVLDTGLVPNESETLIDEKPSDSTRRHTRILRRTTPRVDPRGDKLRGGTGREDAARVADVAPTCRPLRDSPDPPEFTDPLSLKRRQCREFVW
jgi:hypothetical protein